MFSVRHRYLRGYMIEVYEIINGRENLRIDSFFVMREKNKTKSHRFTIIKQWCNEDIWNYSFSRVMIVDDWSRLPFPVLKSDINLKIIQKKFKNPFN